MEIYTDGATSNNGKDGAIGGWAYVIINDKKEIICSERGCIENATNNICELTAIIKACEMAQKFWGCHHIYSDSAYCINCYKQKWYRKWQQNGWINSNKKPVANQELWEKLIPFFENPLFNFEKVEGHSLKENGHAYWNNYVDKLAVAAKEMN